MGGGHHERPSLPPVPEPTPASVPAMNTQEYHNTPTAFEPEEDMPAPRSIWQRYREVMYTWYEDPDIPTVSGRIKRAPTTYEWLTKSMFPLKPNTYVDAYEAPNKCPEEHWYAPWKWPHQKKVNPKVPPPLDGRYNDFYHYHAFKLWLKTERDVYLAHLNLLNEMQQRCVVKEGANANKNCRHLWNKYFAMSRHEEFNQTLLYMAITGNAAIRETPYPADFIEQKRKIYDDWLTRTRMKLPGDLY